MIHDFTNSMRTSILEVLFPVLIGRLDFEWYAELSASRGLSSLPRRLLVCPLWLLCGKLGDDAGVRGGKLLNLGEE